MNNTILLFYSQASKPSMNFNISEMFYCTGSSAVLTEKKKQTVKMK